MRLKALTSCCRNKSKKERKKLSWPSAVELSQVVQVACVIDYSVKVDLKVSKMSSSRRNY
jgi:hypothetical protein